MNNTNNLSARASFDVARQVLFNAMRNKFASDAACWNWVNSTKLSQNELRLEVYLNSINNTFTFGVTDKQNSSSNIQFPSEVRLNLQDSFIMNEYAINVALSASDDDTNFELKTYGNRILFDTAGAADAINGAFYGSGQFQIRVNNDVIMPNRGLYNHFYRGQTQQTAAPGAGSPEDQIRGAEDAFITAEPNILLIGSKNTQPQIVLPRAMPVVMAGTRAVLTCRGILAQNSTVVN